MNDDLIKILLNAEIDPTKLKTTLNQQLESVSKNISKLKVSVDLQGAEKEIEKLSKKMNEFQRNSFKGGGSKTFTPIGNDFAKDLLKADEVLDKITKNRDGAGNVKKILMDVSNGIGETTRHTLVLNEATKEWGTISSKHIENIKAKKIEAEKIEKQIADEKARRMKKDLENSQKLELHIDKLNRQINNGLSKNRGNLSISKMYEDLRKEVNSTTTEVDDFNFVLKKQSSKLADINTMANISSREVGIFGKSIGGLGKELLRTMGIALSFRAVIREFKKGISEVNAMDGALTEIAMVTQQTRQEVAGLGQEYNKLAKEMKVSTSEVSKGAVDFYRQGLNQDEVMKRLQATTKYSKVANTEFSDSIDKLTAVTNSMGREMTDVSDIAIKLGNATSTSADEVLTGVSKVSGTAGALGIELEKVGSWVATISSKTREGAETVGRSVNAILTRMNNIKATGYDEEDGTQINDVSKALSKANIQLMENATTMRDFSVVMDELGAKWHTLDDKTKGYIATTLAGTHQQSRFLNLMNDYSQSLRLYEEALDSAGITEQSYGTYLDSNKAKMDGLKASVEGLWLTFIDGEVLGNLLVKLTDLMELLTLLVEKVDFTKLAVNGGLVVSLILLFSTISKVSSGVVMFQEALVLLGSTLGLTQVGALGFLTTLNPTIIALGLVATAIGFATKKYKDLKNAQAESIETMQKSMDSIKGTKEEVENLDELISKYEDLSSKSNKTVEEKEKLLNIQKELARTYPETATGIDGENNSIATNIDLVKKLSEEKSDMYEKELLATKTLAENNLPKLKQEMADLQARSEELSNKLSSGETTETITDYLAEGVISTKQVDMADDYAKELAEVLSRMKELNVEIENGEQVLSDYDSIIADSIEKAKWKRAEEIENILTTEEETQATQSLIDELIELGFTTEEVAKIRKGALNEVKKGHEVLTQAEKSELGTITQLDATAKSYYRTRLENEKTLTTNALKLTQSRIKMIQNEIKSLNLLAGARGKKNTFQYGGKSVPMSQAGLVKSPTTIKEFSDSIMTGNSLMDIRANALGTEYVNLAKKELSYQTELAEVKSLLKQLDTISTSSVGSIKTGGAGGSKKSGKGSKSKKADYRAEIDYYEAVNMLLEKNNNLLARNKQLQGFETTDSKTKLKLMTEEIALNRNRQQLLHSKANVGRAEAKGLEQVLSKQGFQFNGDGDNRMIANLGAIKGKTKEVEEAFNRYIALQTKEIPSASKSWWDLEKAIKDTKIAHIEASFRITDSAFKDMDKELEAIEYQWKSLEKIGQNKDKDNFVAQAQLTTDKLAIVENKISLLNEELIALNNHGYKEGTREAELYSNRQEELTKILEDQTLVFKSLSDEVGALREKQRVRWIAEQNKLYSEQRDRLNTLGSIQEKIVAVIRKRGEAEQKALDETYKKDKKLLEERHKDRKSKYKDDLDDYKKLIQAKIDALNEQYSTEDYEAELQKEKDIALDMQRQLDILSLDDSLEGKNKQIALKEDLAKQKEKIAKMQQKRERDLEKKALQDMLKNKEKDIKDRENIADEHYANEKDRLEEDYRIDKEFLDRKYSNAQIYSEARKSIRDNEVEDIKGNFVDIETALQDFEDEFGKGMGILGEVIREDFIAELEKAQKSIENLDYKAKNLRKQYDSDYQASDREIGWEKPKTSSRKPSSSSNNRNNRPPEFRDWSDRDFAEYVENKQEWGTASQSRRDRLKSRNEQLRLKYGVIGDYYSAQELMASYDTGGYIGRDGIIMAHEKELVVPAKYQQDLWDFIQQVPNFQRFNNGGLGAKNQSSINTGSSVDIDINVEGNLDKSVLPKIDKIVRQRIRESEENKQISLKKVGVR